MASLKNKVIFITGASRGIGLAIALKAALDGAQIVIAAKTIEQHDVLPGTIYTAAKEIQQAGGRALAIQTDIRDEQQIDNAITQTIEEYGKIDILINNAGAINLTDTLNTSVKKFDLMMDVNVRGSFIMTQKCLPYLLQSLNPHILNIAPPLNLHKKWFAKHCPYTISKYGMSMLILGMAEEFQDKNIAINALWPKTTIATAAVKMLGGESLLKNSRYPSIMADAAYWIITQTAANFSGQFFIDEDIITDKIRTINLAKYTASNKLTPDLFIN